MYLIMKKVDNSPNFELCYRYLRVEDAREKYQELLASYPPSRLAFIETTEAQLGLTIDSQGRVNVAPLEFPIATDTQMGIIRLATALQASYENPEDYIDGMPVSVPPTLIKAMIEAGLATGAFPDATTETAGKVRLATEAEADYNDPSDGEDHLAVMQPVATKDMIDVASQYSTEYALDVRNIKQALDDIYAQMNYVVLKINSFYADKNIFEEGSNNTVTVSWSYNKELTSEMSQTLNGNLIAYNLRQDTLQNVNSSRNATLAASDNITNVSRTITLTFTKKIFWGEAVLTEGANINSLFLKTLRKNILSTSYKNTYDFNLSQNDLYGYIACPISYNMPDVCIINNWTTELENCGIITFVSDYGITTQYQVYRTTYPGLGAFDMTFN